MGHGPSCLRVGLRLKAVTVGPWHVLAIDVARMKEPREPGIARLLRNLQESIEKIRRIAQEAPLYSPVC